MARISNFDLSARQLVDLAFDKLRKGDIIGSARYARNALKVNRHTASAYSVLGCLFSEMFEFECANKAFFRGLHECGDYDNEHIRRGLALNFIKTNQPEVAMYYSDGADADVADMIDGLLDMEDEPSLFLSYPPTEEYCSHLLKKAYILANEGDMSGAMDVVEGIPSEFEDMAVKSKLVMLTMTNDIDKVIEFAERMIAEGKDNVPVRCALASAYLLKDREKEAREVALPLFEQLDKDFDKMFMVLPVAVSLNMHAEIIKIINAVHDRPGFRSSKRLLLWYSQALYNIGERSTAKAVMSDLNAIFAEDTPAYYYLKLYAENPDSVEYSLTIPESEKGRLVNTVCNLIVMSDKALEDFDRKHKEVGDNLDYYFQWALSEGTFPSVLIQCILRSSRAREILQNALISGEVPYPTMSAIIDAFVLANDQVHPVVFNIVAQDRFKHIEFMIPRATLRLPSTLQTAVLLSIADIIFTDEDPNFYLKSFVRIINGIVNIGTDGKLVYNVKSREKLTSLRSAETLVGVFLSKVYEEDESRESILSRYNLNPKLYDKYCQIVFGETND